jgi:hypothetical protein
MSKSGKNVKSQINLMYSVSVMPSSQPSTTQSTNYVRRLNLIKAITMEIKAVIVLKSWGSLASGL